VERSAFSRLSIIIFDEEIMPSLQELGQFFDSSQAADRLSILYGAQPRRLESMRERWRSLIASYAEKFTGGDDVQLFSTPGRTEVGGNHTDHNAGCVLAAAVDLDLIGVAGRTNDGMITVYSEGYSEVTIDTRNLQAEEEERFTTAALIRGICAKMNELGWQIGGFNACMTSDVPKGSGLSSSAAFEVQVTTILSEIYNGGQLDPVQKAIIAQYAENNYFGKPCGLMDQTTCSVGGFVSIDFRDAAKPIVHKVAYDFASSGYALVILETGGDHADLTDEYAAVTAEMKSVAHALGGKVMRDVTLDQLMGALPELHQKVNDRALLRAFHFLHENKRVADEVDALEAGQFSRFLDLVNESGLSSWTLLQNCYSTRSPHQQGIPLALAISAQLLGKKGAYRVHGGGFAGTIQAFIPLESVDAFVIQMELIFGKGTCYPVMVRSAGSIRFDIL
jgi:galactokinase